MYILSDDQANFDYKFNSITVYILKCYLYRIWLNNHCITKQIIMVSEKMFSIT